MREGGQQGAKGRSVDLSAIPFLVSLNSNLLPLFSLSIDCFTRGKRTPSFAIRRPSFQLDCATSQHWWPKLLTCKSDVGAGLMLWRYIEQQIHLMRDLKTHSGEKSNACKSDVGAGLR